MQSLDIAQKDRRPADLGVLVGGLVALWFAAVAVVVYGGYLVPASGGPPIPTALAIVLPLVGFGLLYAFWPAFRDYILTRDIVLLTVAQATRVVGFVFLGFYAYGLLPGLFAWPAGLGDVAVGIGAVFVASRLAADQSVAAESRYAVFHLVGLLDFVVAVGTGVVASGAFPGLYGGAITTAPMTVMPLGMIPAFFVPFYAILHFAALLQVRNRAGRE